MRAVSQPHATHVLRRDGSVTGIELFFDLVYVFAVTQLSHLLVRHTSVVGATETAVLLAMVWQVWVYTTWVTNYLDPNHIPMRVLLVVLMLGSLVMATALPRAFEDRGVVVAVTYLAMQLGRAVFAIVALRGEPLQRTFQRVFVWSTASGIVVLCGLLVAGEARAGLWALAIAIDLVGAAIGFPVPVLGRSVTADWTISGGHFAERCQAFVLIALGESIVVTGSTFADLEHPSGAQVTAFVVAFASSLALWWIYFDRAAEDSTRVIAESDDPGRLGRNAFHWVHPLIIAGIIVAAAADDHVLAEPEAHGVMATAWLVLGGVVLYLGGHAAFKAIVWHVVSWPRIVGLVVLLALFALAPHVTALTLAIAALAVVVAVAVADRVQHPPPA
jgi:low temperature requirement protein LtrA